MNIRFFLGTLTPRLTMFARRSGVLVALSCLATTALHAKLTVRWTDNSWDETAFLIERADGDGSFVQIAATPPDSVSYDDDTAMAGMVYRYRVRAKNDAGYSPYSNVVTNAATIVTQPAASLETTAFTTVTLTVEATGVPAPTYEWKRNGVPLANDAVISGASTATLTLSNVLPAHAGTYTVTITNGTNGYVTSTDSVVTIPKIVPAITWSNPALIDDDIPLGATQLNATANVPGTLVYNPAAGALLGIGTHTLTVTFTPTDAINYAVTSKTVSLEIANLVPTRPATFDAASYLLRNPDIAAVIGNVPDKFDKAWTHYYEHGVDEGRTDGEFDVNAYLAQYPNLAAMFGANLRDAAVHWYTTGRAQGLRIPNGFDVNGYFARNQDIAAYFANDKYGAWLHYYNYGVFEGRTFDANFIAAEYLELNPDLKAAGGGDLQGAMMHWLSWGHPVEDRMGRVPIGFDVNNYLLRYPDLAAAFSGVSPLAVRNVAVWQHFLDYGAAEGRSDGDFDIYSYLAGNPDVAIAVNNNPRDAALHWFFYGRREGRRIPAGFDVHNYRALYPDLVVFSGDDLYGCWLHYRDVGIYEGRIYDDKFRPAEYLALNLDVAEVIGNNYRDALLHWLYYGQYEGRLARF
jgi:hypothetical protein